MTKVRIKNDETFSVTNPRSYYKGTSFHYSGDWAIGVHYFSDQYCVDYVVINNCLLVCKKSHLSSLENKPEDFIRTDSGRIIGINSQYWDFVLAGFDGRITMKHGTTEYWNSQIGFVPLNGEIIIYDDFKIVDGQYVPGIKIGTGNGYVQDLQFLSDDIREVLEDHIYNTIIHITSSERERWNRKLNLIDTVEDEELILTRN